MDMSGHDRSFYPPILKLAYLGILDFLAYISLTFAAQLVFRAKLTQHTAFERTDNTEPAAVTALAVSR